MSLAGAMAFDPQEYLPQSSSFQIMAAATAQKSPGNYARALSEETVCL
jgi:hypothetical protein